ncbi:MULTISPECIES: S9 family peptidase [unclassified Streptomyces]|uniref:alpha/beta hydrolase family protein n=1 Tax=unclassified Streptomyces TaxID=2593676 RepID=UPI0010125731|nr:alpha/beta hydrolase [Streptomyces sp. GZWMJZ-114]
MTTSREITFASGATHLAGLLALPGGPAPSGAGRAGVVLVGGSGPTDRDNGTYFPPLRARLLAAGFAVLSYDKRGVGASGGDWRAGGLAELAEDATAALARLRAEPGVDPAAVRLFGHSEGGWVALRAAARGGPERLVTSGCPAVTPAAQERHALAVRGAAPEVLGLYDRLIAAGRAGVGFAAADELLARAGRPAELDPFWAGVDARTWAFLVRKQDHDPLPDAARLRCPHTALYGADDPLVPVAASARAFAGAAPRATAVLVPGAGHRPPAEDVARALGARE